MRHSSEHVGDALKAERFVQDLDELKLLNRSAQLAPSKSRPRGMTLTTRRALLIGGAAAIALSMGLLISTLRASNAPIRHLTLEDGSVVHLLRGSDFSVEFDNEVRLIQLPIGEAVFEVAKDPERPFIVRSEVSDSVAVGTRFGVIADPVATTTIVSEGEVRVVSHTGDHAAAGRIVRAGEEYRVVAGSSPPQPVTAVDAERKISWSEGWLAFEGETAGEAVRTFNRFSDVQIELAQPELSRARVHYGRFELDRPESFAFNIGKVVKAPVTLDSKRGVIYIGDPQR